MPDDMIIASSSFGLEITDIQSSWAFAERIPLGHPFNPPHLLPLVGIVGDEQTSKNVFKMLMNFIDHWGETPILINQEIKGYVANR
ncbi:3-hydroxyacyl-CoA dehydrogenase NAD-binding domain-containing protein [Acinetobacter sp. TGL-Y2]|uniref:3-hydroxyacyl-CoA dehydrogenase NAD-binding domain-containing protein n=1 Tax=Acinetobacter sp. TGL-Y2 TaxID=1407071 RepID=UPI001D17771F|nr:3-hydroxyacyl-CoA dehydrogenase NAD-binding domain-containing protein [Acinetobacter sp. TGL-Y2]